MSDVNIVVRTQKIIVDPASSTVSVVSAGPPGPPGPEGTGIVDSIVAGTNIVVDASDPHNPIVTSTNTPDPHALSHGNGGDDEVSLDASQITSGTLADARIPAAITRDTELTAGLATKANTVHTHAQSDITGLVTALATKATTSSLGTAAFANTSAFDASGAAAAALASANAYTDDAVEGLGSGSGVVQTVVAGTGIIVDDTDPENPIILATGGGSGGATWALQRYNAANEARILADHVIWYPSDPALDDPENAVDDKDLLFRDDPSAGGGGVGGLVAVADGGTGRPGDWGTYRLVLTGTASDGALRNMLAGTAGYVLASGGTGADPTWVDPATFSPSLDSDLVTIAALSPSNDTIMQRKGGAWVASTPSTVKTDLALVKGDVGLGNVDNTSNATERAATATLTNKTLDDPKINTAINAQTGTSYTFVLSDASKLVTASNASPVTFTVPPNSSVAFPVGTQIAVAGIGAGLLTIAQGSGVTVNATPTRVLRAQYSGATLFKLATDTWLMLGDMA